MKNSAKIFTEDSKSMQYYKIISAGFHLPEGSLGTGQDKTGAHRTGQDRAGLEIHERTGQDKTRWEKT